MKISQLLLVGVAFGLAGCGAVRRLEDADQYSVSAEPLMFTPTDIRMALTTQPADAADPRHDTVAVLKATMAGTPDDRKALLGLVLYDSEQKCGAFLSRIAVAQAGVNTTGDVLTTVLSAIATAVSPVSISHAFSAASTIVGGTKTALDQDLWAKAGMQDFQKALTTSYYLSMREYANTLETRSGGISVPLELTRIQSIHDTCSLAAARNVIDSTLSLSSNPSQPNAPATAPTGAGTNTPLQQTGALERGARTQGVVPGQALSSYLPTRYSAAELAVAPANQRTVSAAPTASSRALRAWIYPAGKLDTDHRNQLEAWMGKVPKLTVPFETFVKGAKFEADRVKAIAALVAQHASGGPATPATTP